MLIATYFSTVQFSFGTWGSVELFYLDPVRNYVSRSDDCYVESRNETIRPFASGPLTRIYYSIKNVWHTLFTGTKCNFYIFICVTIGVPNDRTKGSQWPCKYLLPRHLCREVYSFRLTVRLFVCSFFRSYNLDHSYMYL